MGRACSTHLIEREMHTESTLDNVKERDHWDDLDTEIMLRWLAKGWNDLDWMKFVVWDGICRHMHTDMKIRQHQQIFYIKTLFDACLDRISCNIGEKNFPNKSYREK
jgi:hypothetical protein